MKRIHLIISVAAVAAAWGLVGGAPPPRTDPIVVRNCLIEPANATRLGASHSGVIQECLVEQGDKVKAGQILGRLQDRELRAELEQRDVEARSDLAVRNAEARHELARALLNRGEFLSDKKVGSHEELQKLRAEEKSASLEVKVAKQRQALAEMQRKQKEAAIRERALVCPHDGIVVAVYRTVGESVNPGEPILRVVTTEKLKVTVYVDVLDAWRVRPGQAVQLIPELGEVDLEVARSRFSGKVTFVDPEIDRRTQTCKVVAEVNNPDGLLRAGLDARVEIMPGDPGSPKIVSPARSPR